MKYGLELTETKALYDVMINKLINEYVIVIGLDHKIMDINAAFLKKLGLKKEQAVGHFCHEITHHLSIPCSGKNHPCPLAQVKKTGRSSQASHVHLDQNKIPYNVSISCYPLMENGDLKAVVEVSKDITKEMQFQKNMMQQEKLVSLGRLCAGVAHEINNPLTTILTSSMLMQEDLEQKDPIYDELAIINKETLRCREIVKSLLDFARQSKSLKRKNDLNKILNESLILTRKQAKFNDISLSASLGENLPMVYIDKDQIQQTIINLTLNAIEATGSGGDIKISSRFLKEKKVVKIMVKDTGAGISSENIDKIFDPFFTTKKTGTGLGLAITHGIVEQHKGTIEVESTPGKGSCFIITLPISKTRSNGI
ncbi:MAG: PAS domain-containing protein [Desulfobacula sp.]|nr:PAS domain-containing protein [Desulfobacula sp.]